ncbi:MAG: hypothetical protein ACRDY1_11530, partial [Acidimicrobiales bacterium]
TALLEEADGLRAGSGPLLVPARLGTRLSLPTLPADERRTGPAWLPANDGHGCQHLGHIGLTAQAYRAGRAR